MFVDITRLIKRNTELLGDFTVNNEFVFNFYSLIDNKTAGSLLKRLVSLVFNL